MALFDVTVLLEQARNFSFLETRMDAGDKQIGAGVDGTIIIAALGAVVLDRSTDVMY